MQSERDLKEEIVAVSGGDDVLLVVPPFGSIENVCLSVHILQAVARENGYKVNILYLNMLLASVLGIEPYQQVYSSPLFWMLGDRLFARSAYGLSPLGRNPECCANEAMSISGKEGHIRLFFDADHDFDSDLYLQMERTCKSFLDEAIAAIDSMNYKIVGCNAGHPGMLNCSMALLNGVKSLSPETLTLLGGSNCEGVKAEGIVSLGGSVDYIFSGESETAFLNLLEANSSGDLPTQRILTAEPVGDLDRLPPVDYDICLDQAARFLGAKGLEAVNIWYETSRGCWWAQKSKCKFCGVPQRPHRWKKVDTVVRDLKRVKTSYPDKMLLITDEAMPLAYHEELVPVLRQEEGIPSLGYSLRTHLDFQDMLNLKEANVDAVLPGIESFSTNLLKLMGKGVSARQTIAFLRNANSVGIYCDWLMLWGFPGDRISDYMEVLPFLPLLRHLQPPRAFQPMVFTRFSPYLDSLQEHRIQNLRAWNVFTMLYPAGTMIDELATCYIGEFPCESYENPDIIRKMADEIDVWKKLWRKSNLVMKNVMGDYFIIDNRGLFPKEKTHLLKRREASAVMTSQVYDYSETLNWAVTEKLGVVVDSWYVPLVTAPPEVLLEFERSASGS
jgi:ribosomal peptide maturation radical SAM protein 1